MNVYFWQRNISPHQSSFLRNLALIYKVYLVVDNSELSTQRKKLGWIAPDLTNVHIIETPGLLTILNLFKHENSIHVFSSFYHSNRNLIGLIIAIFKSRTVGIMAEPYYWFGLKGSIRRIREKIFYWLLGRKVDFFLAIGKQGFNLYSDAGYKKEMLFNWGYFTEQYKIEPSNLYHSKKFIISYVGRLDTGKGLHNIIAAISNITEDFELRLIGNGPLREDLENLVNRYNLSSKVIFMGTFDNKKVQESLLCTDLLVLPSDKKDGWGAVINEALFAGTPVICSNNVGGVDLLNEYWRGSVFNCMDFNEMKEMIHSRIIEGKVKLELRLKISRWAQENLSGESASKYLQEIFNYTLKRRNTKPEAPWLKLTNS